MSLTLWQPSAADAQPLPAAWVKALLEKLTARYGTLFLDRYAAVPNEVLVREWATELAGFSGEEIARGLAALRTHKFPPSLPEFMELCRPPVDAETAFHEAIRNMALRDRGENPPWSHPAIYWAAAEIGYFDLKAKDYRQVMARWTVALKKAMDQGAWAPIPVPPKQLPPPPRTRANERVMATIRELTRNLTTPKGPTQ